MTKKLWQKLTNAVLCAITIAAVINTTPVGFASVALPDQPVAAQSEDTASPRAEETIWYTRMYNGKMQKRLWSITRGIWLTDWIDC